MNSLDLKNSQFFKVHHFISLVNKWNVKIKKFPILCCAFLQGKIALTFQYSGRSVLRRQFPWGNFYTLDGIPDLPGPIGAQNAGGEANWRKE